MNLSVIPVINSCRSVSDKTLGEPEAGNGSVELAKSEDEVEVGEGVGEEIEAGGIDGRL